MRHLAFIALVFASVPCECFQNEPYSPRFPARSLQSTVSRLKSTDALNAHLRSRMEEDRAPADRGGTAEPSSAAPKPSVTSPNPSKLSVTSLVPPKPIVTSPTKNYEKIATSTPPPPNGYMTPPSGTRGRVKGRLTRPVSDVGKEMILARARTNSVSRSHIKPTMTTPSNKKDGTESKVTTPSNIVDNPEPKTITPSDKTDSPEPKATTSSNNSDSPGPKVTSPLIKFGSFRRQYTMLPSLTGIQKSTATTPSNQGENTEPKTTTLSNQNDGTESKAFMSSNKPDSSKSKTTTPFNKIDNPEPKATTPSNNIDGPGRKVTTPSNNSDSPGLKVTSPLINFGSFRRQYTMSPGLTGIQKSTATTTSNNSDGSGPKATTPSVYGDGLNLKGTGFTNIGGDLTSAMPAMAFYRGNVLTNPVNTPAYIFRPALTYRKLYLSNDNDVVPDGQMSSVTLTPDSLGNAISTNEKTTASQPFTDSLSRFLRIMRSNAYLDDYAKTDDVAEAAPRQLITDPNGGTYKGRATKPTLTGFRSATV